MDHPLIQLTWYGLISGLFSLAGGMLVLWRAQLFGRVMTPLIAFAAGAFLGVAFLDLLPEAVDIIDEPHNAFMAFLVGVVSFFALERFLMKYFHRHAGGADEHQEHTESLPLLIILGDSMHNFLDGVVIALAYIAHPALGLPTALAIAAHEIPQEIGDFAILLDRGWAKGRIILVNVLSSLLCIVGIFLGYLGASLFQGSLPYLIAGVAGIFTYISLSDLVPELHHRAGHRHFFRVVSSFIIGLVVIGYVISLAHGA